MKPQRLYILLSSVMGFAFHMMFTAAALYRIDIALLKPYQLILLGTALEIAIFIFETPTGVVADLKSRRLSVIIGLFIIGFGFLVEIVSIYFIVIFFSQIIWGLGYTFISGALDSWVSDETDNIKIENTMIAAAQYRKFFSIFGIVIAAVIGMYSIRFAIAISGIVFISLGFFCLIYMKETKFTKVIHEEGMFKSYFIHLTKGFKHIKATRIIRIMFVIMLFFGLYSEGIDRTYELHILDNLQFRNFLSLPPIWIIAIINGFIAIIGFVLLDIVKRYVDKGKHLLLWSINFTMMMIIGLLLFTYFPNQYIALFGFIFFSISREGTYPLLNSILLKNTPSKIKATVLSFFGQLDAIGQLLSGAIMVSLSLIFGFSGMYLVTAIFLFIPVIFLFKLQKL